MQGRLVPPENGAIQSFPRDRWHDEFELAAAAGLDAIEWIDDVWGADVNPLWSPSGRAKLREAADRTGVVVASVCADWFIEHPLGRDPDAPQRLEQLLEVAQDVGAGRITVPFVDDSAIPADGEAALVEALTAALEAAERTDVELHVETDLGPDDFRGLLDQLPHALLAVNYDSGNSASLGYDVDDELAAYGDRIGSVHIKDRVRGGGTVPLGAGNASLDRLFAGLRELQYPGDLVLQVARAEEGDEVAWARHNRAYVEERWRS
jgi:hexulose-6-phosphate isomerase